MTTIAISNEAMNNLMKIVKSLKEAGLFTKDVNKTFQNEPKNKKVDFSACYLLH